MRPRDSSVSHWTRAHRVARTGIQRDADVLVLPRVQELRRPPRRSCGRRAVADRRRGHTRSEVDRMLKAHAGCARRRATGLAMKPLRQLAVYVTLALSAAAPLPAQGAGGPPPFSAPGQLIDVGGWRLHLNCAGTATPSQPTVILEAGIGDFSVEWSLVQPEVAKFARVCSYDRADEGWSDFGPHPRTLH